MKNQYPFFRDEDERTQAVIGADAVDADLDGTYQKPYAVLTQKRLYCKNEQGNFITDASTLRWAGKGLLPGQNWFLWAAVACVSLVLALLCLWHWGLGGQWRLESINNDAQMYIDNYHAFEEQVKEYEEQIDLYDKAQEEIDTLQKTWQEKNYDEVSREVDEAREKIASYQDRNVELQAQIENANDNIGRLKLLIEEEQEWAANSDQYLRQTQQQVENLKNSLQAYRQREDVRGHMGYTQKRPGGSYEPTVQLETVWNYEKRIREAEAEVTNVKQRIERAPETIAGYQQEITSSEAKTVANQDQIAENKVQIESLEHNIAAREDEIAEMSEIQQGLAAQQKLQNTINYENLQAEVKRFQDSRAAYKAAQAVQGKVKLFLPCVVVFALCVVAVIILTVCKRTKTAVLAALASACVGLVCVSLSNVDLNSIQGFGRGYHHIMPPLLAAVLRILPVLAAILGLLALWWNRKRTMYQIVHATGAFFFTPSVYPAEELRLFTQQARLMQEGGADGK